MAVIHRPLELPNRKSAVANDKVLNRRFPAEWEQQDGVQLTWPHDRGDWRDRLAEVEPVFARIASEISQREHVLIVCRDAVHRDHVVRHVQEAGAAMDRIVTALAPSNDTWARDHGPITIEENGKPRLLDFTFNGWGGKYPAALDDAISATLHAAGVFGTVTHEGIDLELEGGAIDSDGQGSLLTTEACLLRGNRNPGLNRQALDAALRRHLGVARVLWLAHGELAGDDTDGHVDTLARFCDAGTIAHVSCDDPADEHFEALAAMAKELAGLRTVGGKPYRLVPLPIPAPIRDDQGQRLPATHANFLIINGAVLVPTYDDPNDAVALRALAGCFPDRTVVPIDCRALIQQYGSLHCITMQLPAGVLAAADA